jgi:hypothetical protein
LFDGSATIVAKPRPPIPSQNCRSFITQIAALQISSVSKVLVALTPII